MGMPHRSRFNHKGTIFNNEDRLSQNPLEKKILFDPISPSLNDFASSSVNLKFIKYHLMMSFPF